MHTGGFRLKTGYSRFEGFDGFDGFGSFLAAKISDTMFSNARRALICTRDIQHMECGMSWKGMRVCIILIVATTVPVRFISPA
jgi:hypothetical protein